MTSPFPSSSNTENSKGDDFHEWSIYRQNLTAALAQSTTVPRCSTLPYGHFSMNKGAIDAICENGQLESQLKDKKSYLSFGLPRINIQELETHSIGMKRSAHSHWDLSAGNELSIYTEETLDTVFDEEAGGSLFLSSSRHHSHYFSNLDLFTNQGYNYLKYAKYRQLQRESRNAPPHLSVSHLSFSLDSRSTTDRILLRVPKKFHALHDISFELTSGDVMALLYTTELEMRTVLRILCDSRVPNGRVRGEISINGHRMKRNQLKHRIAHVSKDDPPPSLTVLQFLRIHSSFKPSNKSFGKEQMIGQLISTLALHPYQHCLCGNLGKTERQRVKIAAQMLRDTDILICDNLTRDFDVYEVAFLVDFLRDWALKLNRIVILAIAPYTLDLLHMFSKTAILASGRLVYFGESDQMVTYFESINFPCPPFKNPCDYYVDLVTHDHLSAESSQDSSRRIFCIADKWKKREKVHLPLRPAPLVEKTRKPSSISNMATLFRQFLAESWNFPLRAIREWIICTLISVCLGLFISDLPIDKRSGINDIFGSIQLLLYFAVIPLFAVWINAVHEQRVILYYDVRNEHCGPMLYIFTKILFSSPLTCLAVTSFTTPMYFLSGLEQLNVTPLSYFSFLLVVLVFYVTTKLLVTTIAYLCSTKILAWLISVSVFSLSYLLSGLSIVSATWPWYLQISRLVSIHYWTTTALLQQIFTRFSIIDVLLHSNFNSTELIFGCERKKILAKKIDEIPIYTISRCSRMRGSQILKFHGFDFSDLSPNMPSFLITGGIVFVFWIFLLFMFLCCAVRCNHAPKYKIKEQ